MKDHKLGIAMSGGSTKGAYQAGALLALETLGILPHVSYAAGTSVGAINAAAISKMSPFALTSIYRSLTKRSEIFQSTWYRFWDWKGMYSLDPLKEMMAHHLSGLDARIEAVACSVSIANSKYEIKYASNHEMDQDLWFKYVMASATVAGMMEPQDEKFLWFDGGFREYIPIKESLRKCERVISIATTARHEFEVEQHSYKWPFKGFLYLYHSIDGAMINELKIGDYINQCDKPEVFVIEPEFHLDIGMFEVSKEKMAMMIDAGYNRVMQMKDQLLDFVGPEI